MCYTYMLPNVPFDSNSSVGVLQYSELPENGKVNHCKISPSVKVVKHTYNSLLFCKTLCLMKICLKINFGSFCVPTAFFPGYLTIFSFFRMREAKVDIAILGYRSWFCFIFFFLR